MTFGVTQVFSQTSGGWGELVCAPPEMFVDGFPDQICMPLPYQIDRHLHNLHVSCIQKTWEGFGMRFSL